MDNEIGKKILEKLEQIEQNTKSKESYQIIVSKNKSDFITVFNPSIQLDPNKEYEIALVDLETYYSFPNITSHNNEIRYFKRLGKVKHVRFPTGSYEFEGLNKEIERQLEQNGDKNAFKLTPNLNTFQSILEVKAGYTVIFTGDTSMKDVLGFIGHTYDAGIHVSENTVQILAINSILVHINIINGSFVNGSQEPVIYSFFPKVSPGRKIVQTPVNPIYLPVSLNNIRDLHVKITDQKNIPLDLRGEEVTIRFHIRQK